jgi:hypothetical protein
MGRGSIRWELRAVAKSLSGHGRMSRRFVCASRRHHRYYSVHFSIPKAGQQGRVALRTLLPAGVARRGTQASRVASD